VERWLTEAHGSRGVSGRARRRFRPAYHDDPAVRITIDEWLNLPRGVTPAVRGLELARQAFTQHVAVSRDLAVLRTVQSLSVLDVRNYRQLVFQLGGYEDDGEDPALATALP